MQSQGGLITALQNQVSDLISAVAGISATAALKASVTLPANNFAQLVSLTLPPGNYVLLGQIWGRPYHPMASLVGIGCQMIEGSNTIGGAQDTLLGYYINMTPIVSRALPSGGTVVLQCRTDDANTVIINEARLIAVRLPTLN